MSSIKKKKIKCRDENGKWIDSSVFQESGRYFEKNGVYQHFRENTPGWLRYWHEERRRCTEGLEVDGERITGDHYFYLNFTQISKITEKGEDVRLSDKEMTFPDFWDGDYTVFWIILIAEKGITRAVLKDEKRIKYIEGLEEKEKHIEYKKLYDSLKLMVDVSPEYLNGGYNILFAKARQKGGSLKVASLLTNRYHRVTHYKTLITAFTKEYIYPQGLFNVFNASKEFIKSNTGWQVGTQAGKATSQGYAKAASYIVKNNVKIEVGLKSEVLSKSFGDSDNARGKTESLIILEEAGAFGKPGHLIDCYRVLAPMAIAGKIKTGTILILGTSGKIDTSSHDFAAMFKNPILYGCMPIKNPCDKGKQGGLFFPVQWNFQGFVDEQGNSDIKGAVDYILKKRKEMLDNNSSPIELKGYCQENPLCSADAFETYGSNIFPEEEIRDQLNKIEELMVDGNLLPFGKAVTLYRKDGIIHFKEENPAYAQPITKYIKGDGAHSKVFSKKGAVVIYEEPILNENRSFYIIGYDPVSQDDGTSLCAIIVYKGFHGNNYNSEMIVAEYIGRQKTAVENDEIAIMLAEFYGAKIMHENNVPSVIGNFENKKKTHLLEKQPTLAILKHVKRTNVDRVYGACMTKSLKDSAEKDLVKYLLENHGKTAEGKQIIGVNKIYSRRLLQELLAYDRNKGNYDLISAMFMVLIAINQKRISEDTLLKKNDNFITTLLNKIKENQNKIAQNTDYI